MQDLFRPEAVAQHRQRLLGTIVLRQAWPAQAAAAVLGLLVLALLAVFFTLGFARRETLSGRLLPEGGMLRIASTLPGQVQQVAVQEGQAVRAGELLLVVSGERLGAQGPAQARVGSALREQQALLGEDIAQLQRQAALNRAALERKLARAAEQLLHLREGLALQQRRSDAAEAALQRLASPEYSVVVSLQMLDDKRSDAFEQATRLRAMRREEATLLAERDALRAEIDAQPLATQRSTGGVRGQLLVLRQSEAENEVRGRWELRAPRAGRVTMLVAETGQSVAAGEELASLVPEGAALEVVLYAPSRAAGQIRPGMAAYLRLDALPHQKFGQFGARVQEVSRSPVPLAELAGLTGLNTGFAAAVPHFRVRARLDEGALAPALAAALKAGMQLEATVTLEHRRFFEWAIEPLLGARGAAL